MDMTLKDPSFIVDEKGNKKAIILDYEYYEDLEDSLDLLKAQKEASGFLVYDEFVKKLKAEGRI